MHNRSKPIGMLFVGSSLQYILAYPSDFSVTIKDGFSYSLAPGNGTFRSPSMSTFYYSSTLLQFLLTSNSFRQRVLCSKQKKPYRLRRNCPVSSFVPYAHSSVFIIGFNITETKFKSMAHNPYNRCFGQNYGNGHRTLSKNNEPA